MHYVYMYFALIESVCNNKNVLFSISLFLLITSLFIYRYLDGFILLFILINCVFLSLDSPSAESKANAQLQRAIAISEVFFTIVFGLEMCLKMCAYGVWRGPMAYLRDGWNVLDFVVVISGLINQVLPSGTELPGMSGLRTVRALRPLRTINRVPGLRVLVVTIINSIPQLNQAAILGLFIFLLFGIIGMQQWQGDMHGR